MSWRETPTRPTTPEELKAGDVILHKGERAVVVSVKSWHDTRHGTTYGVDLVVKGKAARASFVASGRVEVVA